MRSTKLKLVLVTIVATVTFSIQAPAQSVRKGHNLLDEIKLDTAITPGVVVDPFSFRTVDGNSVYLGHANSAQKPTVFLFMSTKCPLAKRYTMRLRRLHNTYHGQIDFFAVFPNVEETHDGVLNFAEIVEYPFRVVRDVNGYLTRQLGAAMTPQAFLLDANNKLCYRGAIDDHRYVNRVTKTYLQDAVEAVVDGRPVTVPSTKTMGCTIHLASEQTQGEIEYTTHIARIIQDNCQSCHREGQVAPFTLSNYEEAVQWATEIKAYTQKRLMPPWSASPHVGSFSNDLSLTEEEINLIAKWVESGTPRGPEKDMPPQAKFNDDWAFGEPDLVFEMPEEYVIGPEGEDDYRHFIIPHEMLEDKFVEAVDVRPGNRNVVHHVIGYVDTSGEARKLDAQDPGPGYTRFGDVGFKPASAIGGWAPGNHPFHTPQGSGRWLPKKCDIVLQVHYYRTGVEERDRTKIGLYFSKAAHPVPVRTALPINKEFVVPAGAKDYEVQAVCEIEEPSYLYSITPHMHLIGETIQVTATLPNGENLPLIRIDDWDFNWQSTYRYRDLTLLPKGTKIHLVATFDNSTNNPNNPNSPPKDMGWGEKTTDEMCLAFLGLLWQSEYDPVAKGRRSSPEAEKKIAGLID